MLGHSRTLYYLVMSQLHAKRISSSRWHVKVTVQINVITSRILQYDTVIFTKQACVPPALGNQRLVRRLSSLAHRVTMQLIAGAYDPWHPRMLQDEAGTLTHILLSYFRLSGKEGSLYGQWSEASVSAWGI